MPAPSSSVATLRPELAGSFEEFSLAMNRQRMISLRVFTPIDVARASGQFGRIKLEELLQGGNTLRSPGGGYNRGDWTFEPANFATVEHGWEEPVDDNESQLYQDFFDAEMVSAARARNFVMQNQESRVAALSIGSGAISTTAGSDWGVPATGVPITDVETAIQAVRTQSGLIANAAIMSWEAFRKARNTDQVVDRIKFWGGQDPNPDAIDEQALAQALGIEEVIVSSMQENTAAEGQSPTIGDIWDVTRCLVCRVARTIDIREPCLGRVFHWSDDGSQIGGMMESYRDEPNRSDIVRVRHQVDEVQLYAAAAHIMTGITT